MYAAVILSALFPAGPARAEAPLRVVTTILPLQIFAMNILPEGAEVSLLIPPGTEVHNFSLRPRDAARLIEADLVIANGGGLDERLVAKVPKSKLVFAWEPAPNETRGRAQADPHVWLDPQKAQAQVRAIATALARIDPARSALYARNSEAYLARLKALDSRLGAELKPLGGRHLVTYHEAFGHFAGRYGLDAFSMTGPGSEQPLPGRIKRINDMARSGGLTALFHEDMYPEAPLQGLARDLNLRICRLSAVETGESSRGFYETAMAENARTIARCLGTAGR